MIEQSLFGGAITCQFPAHWQDLSEIRQVPDHQECWVEDRSTNGNACLVMELLEHQASIAPPDAARFFFDDLAQDCGSETDETTSFVAYEPMRVAEPLQIGRIRPPVGLPQEASVCVGYGILPADHSGSTVQQSTRTTGTAHSDVVMYVAVIRLPPQTTDLLLTLTTPTTNDSTETGRDDTEDLKLFENIVASIQIRDWSLFG